MNERIREPSNSTRPHFHRNLGTMSLGDQTSWNPDLEFDLFEVRSEGTLWRSNVRSAPLALVALEEMGRLTTNECFAIHIPTNEILGRINQTRID